MENSRRTSMENLERRRDSEVDTVLTRLHV